MKPIADKLTQYPPDAEISTLIGNNWPRAIRPRKIVAGEDDEPYTWLGSYWKSLQVK